MNTQQDAASATVVAEQITDSGRSGKTRSSVEFIRDVFSDSGEPSSSRILTFILAIAVTAIVIGLFHHVCQIKDTVALGMWLSALPVIIASLVGLMAAPYAINRSAGSLSDLANIFKR